MLKEETPFPLSDLVTFVSAAADMISPPMANHHRRVALIAQHIAQAMGVSEKAENSLVMASLIHDIGALSLKERLSLLTFDEGFTGRMHNRHGEVAFRLFRDFQPLKEEARIIRFHHAWWKGDLDHTFEGEPVPLESHILHLADRIDILLKTGGFDHTGREDVIGRVRGERGRMFSPAVVDAFCDLALRECFWYEITLEGFLGSSCRLSSARGIDTEGLIELSRIYCRIIDFRSRFTATHSSGVAAVTETLAKNLSLPDTVCRKLIVAGYLHDLGKLAVPGEILDKPALLDNRELVIMRRHPFLTYKAMTLVQSLEDVALWASGHHERMDGSGYPFHLPEQDIPLEARIVAAADVFTALMEERPYRGALTLKETLKIMGEMVSEDALDGGVIDALMRDVDEVDEARQEAQESASQWYRLFEGESAALK